eukprot:3882520-Amphidinium_carterae.1
MEVMECNPAIEVTSKICGRAKDALLLSPILCKLTSPVDKLMPMPKIFAEARSEVFKLCDPLAVSPRQLSR